MRLIWQRRANFRHFSLWKWKKKQTNKLREENRLTESKFVPLCRIVVALLMLEFCIANFILRKEKKRKQKTWFRLEWDIFFGNNKRKKCWYACNNSECCAFRRVGHCSTLWLICSSFSIYLVSVLHFWDSFFENSRFEKKHQHVWIALPVRLSPRLIFNSNSRVYHKPDKRNESPFFRSFFPCFSFFLLYFSFCFLPICPFEFLANSSSLWSKIHSFLSHLFVSLKQSEPNKMNNNFEWVRRLVRWCGMWRWNKSRQYW